MEFTEERIRETAVAAVTILTEQLETVLADVERRGDFDDRHINDFFRITHSIKSYAGLANLYGILKPAPFVENIAFVFREDPDVAADRKAAVDIYRKMAKFFKEEIARIRADAPPDMETARALAAEAVAYYELYLLQTHPFVKKQP